MPERLVSIRAGLERGTGTLADLEWAVAEIDRLTFERDAVLRWSIRHAGYIGTREPTPTNPYRWWARGDAGIVYAPTAEDAVRLAAGLGAAPAAAPVMIPAPAPAPAPRRRAPDPGGIPMGGLMVRSDLEGENADLRGRLGRAAAGRVSVARELEEVKDNYTFMAEAVRSALDNFGVGEAFPALAVALADYDRRKKGGAL